MRRNVRTLAGYGLPHDQIATFMTINKTTLYNHYRADLDMGIATANTAIARSLYEQAVGRPAEYGPRGKKLREELKPDRSVSIFLGKARLGMKDTQYVGIALEDLDFSLLDDKESEQLAKLIAKANKARSNP
jgi:hypothetical protein